MGPRRPVCRAVRRLVGRSRGHRSGGVSHAVGAPGRMARGHPRGSPPLQDRPQPGPHGAASCTGQGEARRAGAAIPRGGLAIAAGTGTGEPVPVRDCTGGRESSPAATGNLRPFQGPGPFPCEHRRSPRSNAADRRQPAHLGSATDPGSRLSASRRARRQADAGSTQGRRRRGLTSGGVTGATAPAPAAPGSRPPRSLPPAAPGHARRRRSPRLVVHPRHRHYTRQTAGALSRLVDSGNEHRCRTKRSTRGFGGSFCTSREACRRTRWRSWIVGGRPRRRMIGCIANTRRSGGKPLERMDSVT